MPSSTITVVETSEAAKSAHSILPTELWFSVFALCETTVHLPATFRITSSDLFKVGSLPHRIWTHRTIFLDQTFDPRLASVSTSTLRSQYYDNLHYPSTAQIVSRLANYLKTRPHFISATGDGQSCRRVADCMVTKELIDWLFSASGPFRRQRQSQGRTAEDWVGELQSIRAAFRIDKGTQARKDAVDTFPNWRLLPDSLLLAAFSIRTSQLEVLESTLKHVRSALPSTLATTTAPFSLWCHFMLNIHLDQRIHLQYIVDMGSNPSMTYPTFLCFLAILEWSLAALQIVSRVFSDALDVRAAAALFTSSDQIFRCVLDSLRLRRITTSNSSASVLAILDWFKEHSVAMNAGRLPFVSPYVGSSYQLFLDVFASYDVANLAAFPDNPARAELSVAVVNWVCKGHVDLLHVALRHKIVNERGVDKVLRRAALDGDKALAGIILDAVGGGDDKLGQLVISALRAYAPDDPIYNTDVDPPPVYCFLLNILVTRGSGSNSNIPNQLFIDHGLYWSRDELSVMFFDCAESGELLFEWDYPRHLHQHLAWAMGPLSRQGDRKDCAFMGALIDRCTVGGFDWQALDADQVATACAIRLIALMGKNRPCRYDDNDESKVCDKAVGVIRTLVAVTLDKIKQGSAAHPHPRFLSLIGHSDKVMLSTLIDTVTSYSRFKPPAPDVINCPSTAFNVFLDSMLVLDRAFTVSHIQCVPAAVFAWHKLAFDEISGGIKRVSINCAIGVVRAAAEVKNDDALSCIVSNLPSEVRDSEMFLLGLDGVMRRWPDREVEIERVLDQSGWDAWRDKVARCVDVPLADGVDEEANESSDASSCDEYDLFASED